jgi:hypothetical protein
MGVKTIGTMTLDELFASGKTEAHTRTITLAANATLKRGQLIGTDGTKFGAISTTYSTPYGILAGDIEATNKALVYVTGHFNANKVTGYVEATHYNDLRNAGIIVEKAFAY